MEAKAYIFKFDKEQEIFILLDIHGEQIIINNTHKKYQWLQGLAPEKIVKINAKGRWNSSKDYQNIRQQINNLERTNPVQQVNKTKNSIPSPAAKTESLLGIHTVELKVDLADMLQKSLKDIPKHSTAKLAISSVIELSKRLRMQAFEDGVIAGRYDAILMDVAHKLLQHKIKDVDVEFLQKNFKLDTGRAKSLYNQLLRLRILKCAFATSHQPKDTSWPLMERLFCASCQGNGATYTYENRRSGFLNLKQTRVEIVQPCTDCNQKGYHPKMHFPFLIEKEWVSTTVPIEINLDKIAQSILDNFITEAEFSESVLKATLELDNYLITLCQQKIRQKKGWVKADLDKTLDFPIVATWAQIKEMSKLFNHYKFLSISTVKELIKLLFKHQILEIGTKRRSTKDKATYYKLSKEAKKIYALLGN